MHLPIPTWLLFLFLGIAAFAPLASRTPGRWLVAYYISLFACWIVVSIAAVRQLVREGVTSAGHYSAKLRYLRSAQAVNEVESEDTGGRRSTRLRRRIVVAGHGPESVAAIHGETVLVLVDRRQGERRQREDPCAIDRRRGDRRQYDVKSILATRGWAEVRPSMSEDEDPTP
jgi:hypothetical protein